MEHNLSLVHCGCRAVEAASSSEATVTAPSADRGRTGLGLRARPPTALLHHATVPRTPPLAGQKYSSARPTRAEPVKTSDGGGHGAASRKPAGAARGARARTGTAATGWTTTRAVPACGAAARGGSIVLRHLLRAAPPCPPRLPGRRVAASEDASRAKKGRGVGGNDVDRRAAAHRTGMRQGEGVGVGALTGGHCDRRSR